MGLCLPDCAGAADGGPPPHHVLAGKNDHTARHPLSNAAPHAGSTLIAVKSVVLCTVRVNGSTLPYRKCRKARRASETPQTLLRITSL